MSDMHDSRTFEDADEMFDRRQFEDARGLYRLLLQENAPTIEGFLCLAEADINSHLAFIRELKQIHTNSFEAFTEEIRYLYEIGNGVNSAARVNDAINLGIWTSEQIEVLRFARLRAVARMVNPRAIDIENFERDVNDLCIETDSSAHDRMMKCSKYICAITAVDLAGALLRLADNLGNKKNMSLFREVLIFKNKELTVMASIKQLDRSPKSQDSPHVDPGA